MGRTLNRSHLPLLLLPVRAPSIPWDATGDLFTPAELAAAEQLVQLSESSAESAAAAPCAAAESSSSSSSPRSVNTRPPPEAVMMEAEEEEEEEEEEETGLRRRTKRYRPIADLYAATRPIKGRGLRLSRACDRRLRF
ncbi:hypothetical protein Cni_G27392 [Canna indica]|uniref:Uncharacterized protein n=1 Tax=Canna indica TaxID=4628 RepID=A0AAQ3L1C6_9LILI|nr:hypothetical protein Cni_G27392 [Canna indica]